MKLAGEYALGARRERIFVLLQDPAVLARCMPGCERLDRIVENQYAMRMKMMLASIGGLFEGKVSIADSLPPESFRLVVEGTGKIGFMKGEGVIALTPSGEETKVQYTGEVHVGGTIANVGQRLIETTAKLLIRRFFDKLREEASATATAGA
jgi:hypothetical protein